MARRGIVREETQPQQSTEMREDRRMERRSRGSNGEKERSSEWAGVGPRPCSPSVKMEALPCDKALQSGDGVKMAHEVLALKCMLETINSKHKTTPESDASEKMIRQGCSGKDDETRMR